MAIPANKLGDGELARLIGDVRLVGQAQVALRPCNNLGATHKEDGTDVSLVDKHSDAELRKLLARVRNLPIVSEENDPAANIAAMKSPGEIWMLDPLDGTQHYLKHDRQPIDDHYSINIALMGPPDTNGERIPVFGLIYFPEQKLIYFTGKNGAAMRGEFPDDRGRFDPADMRGIRSNRELPHEKYTTGTRFLRLHVGVGLDKDGKPREADAEFFRPFLEKSDAMSVNPSTNAWREIEIAQGTWDAGICAHRTCQWDIAATDAILRAAGARMVPLNTPLTRPTGQKMTYKLRENSFGVSPFEMPPHMAMQKHVAATVLKKYTVFEVAEPPRLI